MFVLCSFSVAEVLNHLNSNQRVARSNSKTNSSPTMNSSRLTFENPTESKFVPTFSDSPVNFLPSAAAAAAAYSLVNPDLANYAADAFVYSHLSDLNYRTNHDGNGTNLHPNRMNPYARQTSFYPTYNQREIHSPSTTRSTADYA